MHSSWLIFLGLFALAIPQNAAVEHSELPPAVKELIASLPECSRLRHDLARGQFSNEPEKPYMRRMLEHGLQRAFFEFEGTWHNDHADKINIVRRTYFTQLDGPDAQITDSATLKEIENSSLQKILDQATLDSSRKAHLFAGIDAWAGIGVINYWRWRLWGSRIFGSTELFANKWPLSPDLVTPGRPRSDIAHAALVGDVVDLSRLLHEKKHPQTELNWALNDAVMSLWDNSPAIRMLIKAGADVNARFGDQTTPLMNAYECSCNIPVLLAHGARIGDRDKWGQTAFDHARQRHDQVAMRLLQNLAPNQH